jgi:hypothetical protein
VVKYFRGSFGWIVCEAVAVDFPGRDIMVHKSDCLGDFRPKQGDTVSFRLALNGRVDPQAMKVGRFEAVEINAREWFQATTAERSKLRTSTHGVHG